MRTIALTALLVLTFAGPVAQGHHDACSEVHRVGACFSEGKEEREGEITYYSDATVYAYDQNTFIHVTGYAEGRAEDGEWNRYSHLHVSVLTLGEPSSYTHVDWGGKEGEVGECTLRAGSHNPVLPVGVPLPCAVPPPDLGWAYLFHRLGLVP